MELKFQFKSTSFLVNTSITWRLSIRFDSRDSIASDRAVVGCYAHFRGQLFFFFSHYYLSLMYSEYFMHSQWQKVRRGSSSSTNIKLNANYITIVVVVFLVSTW